MSFASLGGTLVQPFHEVHFGGKHIRFLSGVHALLLRMEPVFALALVGDHLFDQSHSSIDHE